MRTRAVLAAVAAGLTACGFAVAASAATPHAAEKQIQPRTISAGAGDVSAHLMYYAWPNDFGRALPRLTLIRRGARQVERMPRSTRFSGAADRVIPYALGRRPLRVDDLDGDGEPEVLVDLYWGGTRCCMWTRIYRFGATAERYKASIQFWGNFQDFYRLEDLDHDGRPELIAHDGRIEQLSSTWSYFSPIRIFSYRHGRLVDVTRRFPALVAKDARMLHPARWTRESLSAWVADQYRLGHRELAERVIRQARQRGQLEVPRSWHAGSATAYLLHLHTFLRKTGYA